MGSLLPIWLIAALLCLHLSTVYCHRSSSGQSSQAAHLNVNNNHNSNKHDNTNPEDEAVTSQHEIETPQIEPEHDEEIHNTKQTKCRPSEFFCDTGQCIPLSQYCDGDDDCGDKSDEPPFCSPCNRTYLGDAGRTYELEIRRPREDRLPFLCHLNFTAAGGQLGDLVQLTFDTFTVGRFVSFTVDGCPDGHMSITEQGRPVTGGQWCGSAWGYTVYYSETPSINLTLRLDRLSQQGVGYNFDFKLSYKFLKKSEAKLRYEGGAYDGDLVPGTYCTRELEDCDKRPCRIRSPNFPGVYPRNLTCSYRVHQRPAPPGMHTLLAVRQPDGHKLHIKEQAAHYERGQRLLRSWEQCDLVQDFLSVRDGRTSTSPELARLCGGDAVPDIISSGPDMLLEFKTSAYDSPFHPVPVTYLPGFELEVHVIFVSAQSHSYVRTPGRCEFIISAFEGSSGVLESPRHSLPPLSVCRYHFQGRRHEIVWLAFIKYHAAPDLATFEPPTECSAQLRIWDGRAVQNSKSSAESQQNATLLGEVCREETPKLCPRSLVAKGARPCSASESYLSSGPDMTLEYRVGRAGPAPSFRLRYEFVDTSLGGAPFSSDSSYIPPLSLSQPSPLYQTAQASVSSTLSPSCDRVYRSSAGTRGVFKSPPNVFLYGRGGAQNLSCTVRFEGDPGESVRITITQSSFGGRGCVSKRDAQTGRWYCNYRGNPRADIRISELPWNDVSIPRDCICSNDSTPITLAPVASQTIDLVFTVNMMNVIEDFKDYFYEGRFEFLSEGCMTDWEDRRLKGPSGEIGLRVPQCPPLAQPWLIEPESNSSFLVLRLRGFWMPARPPAICPTDSRVIVYPAANPRSSRELCPSGPELAVFSEGWGTVNVGAPLPPHARSLVVELRQSTPPSPPSYRVAWLEVTGGPGRILDCPHRCPELEACIPPLLWCDGIIHCPSGHDESPSVCRAPTPLSPLHVGLGAAAFTILLASMAGLTACAKRIRSEKKSGHPHHNSVVNGSANVATRYPHHTHQLPITHGHAHLAHSHHPHHHGHHTSSRQMSMSDDLYYGDHDEKIKFPQGSICHSHSYTSRSGN